MNRRVLKKKFYQEVICNVHGVRNSRVHIALRFISLCFKALGGALLTLVLAPISLFRPIEIWQMNTRLSKISFFIESLETGLRDLQSRNLSGRVWIIALYPIDYPNSQLTKMYRRHMSILGKRQRWLAESARFVWPIFRVVKKSVVDRSQSKYALWNKGKPTLSFTAGEIKKGMRLNKDLGPLDNTHFVCLTIPSRKYREEVDLKQTEHLIEPKENLLATIPDLESYIPAIQDLNSKDIAVVRMGVHEEFKLPESLGQRAIDYAFLNRSEFGDVWLSSRCLFYLTGASGAWWFGSIFNKPAIATDCYELRGTYGSGDIFIPQLSRSIKKDCLNSFEWMIKNQQWAFDRNRLGIDYEIVKNTPRQITEVTTEMLMRIQSNWNETDEDRELQKRFRLVQEKLRPADRAPARMGAKFLREHQHLLPQ